MEHGTLPRYLFGGFMYYPRADTSEVFADQNDVERESVEEVERAADTVPVAGILDIDENVVLVGLEHRFDQKAVGRPELSVVGGETLYDVYEDWGQYERSLPSHQNTIA